MLTFPSVELDIDWPVMVSVPSVELGIFWPVMVTVPSMKLGIYWPVMLTVPSLELDISSPKDQNQLPVFRKHLRKINLKFLIDHKKIQKQFVSLVLGEENDNNDSKLLSTSQLSVPSTITC